MWDAATDPATGRPEAVGPVKFGLSASGEELSPVDPATSGKLALEVRVDKGWLTDPVRVFPITIDPTYEDTTSAVTFDTFVQAGDSTDHSGDGELQLGFDGSNASRSFLNIDTASLAGRTIMSGSLSLWGTWSGSCTPSAWSAYTAGLASTSTRWTAQPTIGTRYATSTATKGFDGSCAAGSVSIDMRSQLQAWATAGAGSQGLLLRADSETDPAAFKRFESMEGAHPPVLRWTANRAPGKLGTPVVAGSRPYKPAGSSVAYLYSADTKPNLSAVASDPDADNVSVEFQASTSTTFATIAGSCTTAAVASGGTAACEIGTALAADGKFYVRGRVKDSGNSYGAYSDPLELRMAAVVPTPPVVTCPAPYTQGSWQTAAPSGPVTCTVTAVGTGYSAPSAISVEIDTSLIYIETPITQSSSTSVAKITVTVPNTSGGHAIRALAVSPSRQYTGTTYYLGWGSTPMLKRPVPSSRLTVTDRVELVAAGKGQASPAPTAKAQWRISGATGTTGWKDAPAGNPLSVSQTSGQTLTSGWFDTTTIVGQADAAGKVLNERIPTLIDLRVCITLSTGTGCTGQTTVLRVPHAFGSGFPVADAGPGQVALWTGELGVDDADAELAIPGGSLSVSRSHSSFAGAPG
ncbi:MAG TPA: DNRLRE domain-containing protein, partial [Candidatus Nanopelagicales bacterium]|nr:DNRLRE domain-containing protein [Candidatus Nanopelagicales bacterium]